MTLFRRKMKWGVVQIAPDGRRSWRGDGSNMSDPQMRLMRRTEAEAKDYADGLCAIHAGTGWTYEARRFRYGLGPS